MFGTSSNASWFRRVALLGIALAWTLAIPALFHPHALLGRLGLAPLFGAGGAVRAGAALLVALSVFAAPGAVEPARHPRAARAAVVLPGALAALLALLPGAPDACLVALPLALVIAGASLLGRLARRARTGRIAVRGEHVEAAA